MKDIPFLYGAQYYRAPTPSRDHWAADLADMRQRGFNTVKFWVQWRWSERRPGEFYWDGLDELMRLADANGLRVVLNLILDVMPEWVERDYPDCVMVDIDGRPVHGEAIPYRQLGGYPGPCYAHDATTLLRQRFFREAVRHFRDFPAMFAWDVWNEPERHGYYRGGEMPRLCFCPSCRAKFKTWVSEKYRTIDRLNEVWGRCYTSFDAVEVPVHYAGCVKDFINWREFQSETLHQDAAWRLAIVRELDPKSVAHLHVVVDTGALSPVTGVDDYALGRQCDIFGSTMQNDPYACAEGISAAQGRPFYNAEWHINYGSLDTYPRKISRDYFLSEQLAQLGWGIRGFLFWQYRTEVLGTEAPAWGLVRPDGSERPTLAHATEFLHAFLPYAERYAACRPASPQVLLWHDARNESFHQARYQHQWYFHDAFRAYSEALYALGVPFGFADTAMLEAGAGADAQVLVLPAAMYIGEREAKIFRDWVASGKTLLSEGNLGAYNADTNRFSATVPAFGLAEAWGIRECEYSSTRHAKNGGECLPLEGDGMWAALDLLELDAPDAEVLATFDGAPIVVRKGRVYYAGTQLGVAAQRKGGTFLQTLLRKVLATAGVTVETLPQGVHIDRLCDAQGECRFLVASFPEESEPELPVPAGDGWKRIIDASGCALYVRE